MTFRVLALDDDSYRQLCFSEWYGGSHDYALVQVRTAAEAIEELADDGLKYDVALLDHDLAEEHYLKLSEGLSESRKPGQEEYLPGTGMDVVKFICSMPVARRPKLVVVHSWNPYGASDMEQALRAAGGMEVHRIPFNPNIPVLHRGRRY